MPKFIRALLAAFACGQLGGCGGGGGFDGILAVLEAEPNNGAATANPLERNRSGTGELAVIGDVDCWAFSAAAGEWIQIELFATRFDQEGWDGVCNSPQLTLFSTDGTTRILEHAYNSGWEFGRHDLDFPLFRIAQTGTYYVCVAGNEPGVAGADYSVLVRTVAGPSLQGETEPRGVTGQNDGPLAAEPIQPGTLRGHHPDDDSDYYSFTLPGASLVCFELVSYRNGLADGDNDYFHAELRLFAPDGGTLLTSSGGVYFGDPLLCARIAAGGTYYVEVRESSGSGDAGYLLRYILNSVAAVPSESEPNDAAATADATAYGQIVQASLSAVDVDFFSFAGTAGDAVHVEALPAVIGTEIAVAFFAPDGTTELPSTSDAFSGMGTARTILPTGGTHYVRFTTASAGALVYNATFSRLLRAGYESEPNGAPIEADPLDASGRAAGTIPVPGDADLFGFSAREGQLVVCSAHAARADPAEGGSDGWRVFSGRGSTLKPRLRVLRANGTALKSVVYSPPNSCSSGESVVDALPTLGLAFVAPASESYFVEVTAEDGTGSASHAYIVSVR
ncbi:MAG: PPC domain-containing protein [Planctomycetota bacterium]